MIFMFAVLTDSILLGTSNRFTATRTRMFHVTSNLIYLVIKRLLSIYNNLVKEKINFLLNKTFTLVI